MLQGKQSSSKKRHTALTIYCRITLSAKLDKCSSLWEVGGQLLESQSRKECWTNSCKRTVKPQSEADSLSSRDEIAIKRTNAQILQTNWSPKCKFYKPRKNSRRKLEYEAVSNPAPGNKLIIMCLFH